MPALTCAAFSSAKILAAAVETRLNCVHLARKQRLGRRRFLFEHVHGGQRHDHLVCTRCGRVVEFVSPGIAALQAEICRAHGFVPASYSLQINSLCQGCAAAERMAAADPGALADAEGEGGRLHV